MNKLTIAFALLIGSPAFAQHEGKVPWITDAETALATAKSQGKPVMLYFSASW